MSTHSLLKLQAAKREKPSSAQSRRMRAVICIKSSPNLTTAKQSPTALRIGSARNPLPLCSTPM
jgi:hypothetical protein